MPLYIEKAWSQTPSFASMGNDGGTLRLTYYVKPNPADLGVGGAETPTDALNVAIIEFLGDTDFTADPASGGLKRKLPMRHPIWPTYRVSKILSIRGLGKNAIELAVPSDFDRTEENIVDGFAEYQQFEVDLEFTQRAMTYLSDKQITAETVQWYDDDGDYHETVCAREVDRFVDVRKGDIDVEVITAQFGQMLLRGPAGGDKAFPAMPSIRQPRSCLLVLHALVPYSWFMSPRNWYDQANGRVNQHEIFGYQPGQLVLRKANAIRFVPPLPDQVVAEELELATSIECLCDVLMTFDICPRVAKVRYTPSNQNHKIDGWNALPNIDRAYYYTTTRQPADTAVGGTPPYKSFPMMLLFRAPIDS